MNTFKQGKALMNLSEAKAVIKGQIMPLFEFHETVQSEMALGRILAENIYAEASMPPFKKATMDGYALGSISKSAYLIVGEVLMGEKTALTLNDEEAVYVTTGAALPLGTVAFVKMEGCQVREDQKLYITKEQEVGNHWIDIGEDISKGSLALEAGQKLSPRALGFLSLLGVSQVKVKKKLNVGILTTGDELVPSFARAPEGKIRDINQVVLKGLLEDSYCRVIWQRLVVDEVGTVNAAMREALETVDLLITSGASSMGRSDVIPELMEELSEEGLLFHGLNIKPGKPVGLAKVGNKVILALPGNPVSSAMTFVVIGQYLIETLLGISLELRQISGILEKSCVSQEGKMTFYPVKISSEGQVVSPLFGKSGLISIVAVADGFIAVMPNECLYEGQTVTVHLF